MKRIVWIAWLLALPLVGRGAEGDSAPPAAAGAKGDGGTASAQAPGKAKGKGVMGRGGAPVLDAGDTPATATPMLNAWQEKIAGIIDRCETSGRLSAAEAKRFRGKLESLREREARAKRNDILDREERLELGSAARGLVDDIYRKAGLGKAPESELDAGS